ncbi:MAG TPA: 2-C-methyl-D-erythritol 4-phosphate cytidylyltransferase [Candidatus Acidoferrum sp.]|jgi:2-C-methyl-D-erythritol 4-phosphate cytidylyltransferase|nr:2-C-methyl-D-erythritol 4-phosphate cytidylyltransferase [Candidatus Acidoferrum sp.]
MNWGAIVVAAGRGTRFGRPKQLIEIAGRPMLAWSVATFHAMPEIERVIVVTESEWLDDVRAAMDAIDDRAIAVVPGGATRQASVRCGLEALGEACDAVLVHDGARPLVKAQDVRAGMDAVGPGRGALLAAPVVDTIKLVDSKTRLVERTLDRAKLWAAQTPQFAMRAELQRAHDAAAAASLEATDDVALLEAIGIEVVVIPVTAENFKVTHPGDAARAELLLGASVK